jgi:hypothetical protein
MAPSYRGNNKRIIYRGIRAAFSPSKNSLLRRGAVKFGATVYSAAKFAAMTVRRDERDSLRQHDMYTITGVSQKFNCFLQTLLPRFFGHQGAHLLAKIYTCN